MTLDQSQCVLEVGSGRWRRTGRIVGLWSLRVSIDQGKVPFVLTNFNYTLVVSCD
jgi:hypothetical protein